MPENPKLFINDIPIEICTSVQKGLPFVSAKYMEIILKGCLAAAQSLFPVTICHLVIMANHLHILLIVKNPEDVPKFMDYFKTESAHALNSLMGTKGQSFWVDGYDSPPILSPSKFLERMQYLYLNPVEAALTKQVSLYKGISTYKELLSGDSVTQWKKLSRNQFSELPTGFLSNTYLRELAESFEAAKGVDYSLKIEPWAWLRCYPESTDWQPERIRASFLTRLKDAEQAVGRENKSCLSFELQENRDIRMPYKSKRSGKKSICLSDCPTQRSYLIAKFKEFTKQARLAFKKRRAGEHSAMPPPGFFLPGGVLLANISLPFLFLL